MSTLNNVFEARRKAQEELRSLYDAAEGRALDAVELETEERLAASISELQKRETNLVAMAEDEKRAAEAAANAPKVEAKVEKRDIHADLRELARGERRSVEIGYEQRDNVNLNKGTSSDGQELVESELLKTIHDLMVETSPIMGLANVLRTAGGADLVMPRVTSHSAAALVTEAGAFGKDAPQFDTVTVGAYKYGFLVPITRELEQDSAFNVGGWVASQGAAALGRGVDAVLVAGDGSSKPTGVVNATTGLTTSATGAVTMDELIEAQHSVIQPQRSGAVWVVNDSTIEAVRKLKDGDQNYIWRPGATAGAPDTLLGNRIYADPNISDMGAGNTFGVFGDLKGFTVRIAGGVVVDRSDQVYFENDMVAYRFLVRVDSAIVDTTGIRALVNAS